MRTGGDNVDPHRPVGRPWWRRWYKLKTWETLRRAQLRRAFRCERCLAHGRQRLATVVHHRVPHRGDWSLFIDPENHESLCKPCHDRAGQADDKRGFSVATDGDGWPIDPRHPANRTGGGSNP